MASTDDAGTKNQETNKPKRFNNIALGSVIAAFSVVLLHTNSFWSFTPDSEWLSKDIIECIFYFAVPVFFMNCGVTNIDYRDKYSTKEFLKRRFIKTFIPFVFWTLMGLLFNIVNHFTKISEITPEFLIRGFIENRIVITFWFFWPLFGIYLCMPFISLIPKDKRLSIFKYMIAIGMIFDIIPRFVSEVFSLNMTSPITVLTGSEYVLYVFIGYVIAHSDIRLSRRVIIYVLGLAAMLVHLIGTYRLSMAAGYIVDTYKGYTKLICFIYSAAAFLLIKQISSHIRSEKAWKVINKAATYTFPVYLMHTFFISMSTQLGVTMGSPFYRFAMPFITILLCVIVAENVRKIPVIKHLLP